MKWLAAYFTLAIVLDHAHLVCLIGLAWSSRRCRGLMLRKWDKCVLWPVGLIAVSVAVGALAPVRAEPVGS